jgi:hypothetical protein
VSLRRDSGDLDAARERVEIRKENEGRSSDKCLLELLSPELRDANRGRVVRRGAARELASRGAQMTVMTTPKE